MYDRTYDNVTPGGMSPATLAADGGPTGEADPASVSSFRLDKYEVTVGRFRQFVNAWNGGAGYTPPAGSGKHVHLNGGNGLRSVGGDAGLAYEPGWIDSDNSNVAPTNANLTAGTYCAGDATWTASAGSQENLPITCVNWYEAYAFCIWDGGFLPSEAEWEYAAAGGSQQREYPWGSTPPGTGNRYAIYGDATTAANGTTCYYPSGGACTGLANIAPVGTATAGAAVWGQLDLAGNVEEWDLDWYAPSYVDPCIDCSNLSTGVLRGVRGGFFRLATTYLLSASRGGDTPMVRGGAIGFRCARTP